jgi:hypothetical protein
VTGKEVSAGQLRRLAGGELSEKTEEALANPDHGVAVYQADRGGMKCVVSFGGPGADLPGRFPPSMFGDLLLDAWVMPEPVIPTMRSPLMDWKQPPQIHVKRGQSETLRPDVELEMRERREPRPPSDPKRYLIPGREEEEVRPARVEKWW